MKKILSVIFVIILLSTSVLCASAAQIDTDSTGKTTYTIGDWVYEAIDGGSHWELDEYLGVGGDIYTPRIVNDKMVTTIGNHCFVNNTTVRSVETSSPLWIVGDYAFLNCTSLESFECNFALKEIKVGAFSGTTSLRSINLEDSVVTVINPHTFTNSGIAEAVLPETCTEIKHDAFSQCPNLEKLVIPRSVTTIDDAAFAYSNNLIIYCYTDSAAHQFAAAKSIPYVLLDGAVLGDVTGDNQVTISDVTEIQRHTAEFITLDGVRFSAGDVNRDGIVNIIDATIIQRYLAEYEVEEPIGTASVVIS